MHIHMCSVSSSHYDVNSRRLGKARWPVEKQEQELDVVTRLCSKVCSSF